MVGRPLPTPGIADGAYAHSVRGPLGDVRVCFRCSAAQNERFKPETPNFAAQFQGTMAQDPQAQANRKRNATRKIARLKAAAAAKQEVVKTEKAS